MTNGMANATWTEYLFGFTFTRSDENDAIVRDARFPVIAADQKTAERRLREQNAHLTILSVRLVARGTAWAVR